MAALFQTASKSGGHGGGSSSLVEFRAGKLNRNKDWLVTPDKRKGLICVEKGADGLTHFIWKDRSTKTVEDDLMLFPGECEMVRLKECTTGRVYLLKFGDNVGSARRHFFWMQEPNAEKDDELVKKVNDILSGNVSAGGAKSTGGPGGAQMADGGGLQSMLSQMPREQLMQLIESFAGGSGGAIDISGLTDSLMSDSANPSTTQSSAVLDEDSSTTTLVQPDEVTATPPAAPRVASGAAANSRRPVSPNQIKLDQLTSVLQNIGTPVAPGAVKGAGTGGQALPPLQDPINLALSLKSEVMIPLLSNPDIREKMLPFLPEEDTLPKTEDELRNTIHSPQFKQALESFCMALGTGQLGPVLEQFGVSPAAAAAARNADMEAFAKAMENPDAVATPSDTTCVSSITGAPCPTPEAKKKDDKGGGSKDKMETDDDLD